MHSHDYPGKFIVVEGLDGSGNTTQAELLTKRLNEEGSDSFLTKEPTDSLIGGLIRSRLKGEWDSSSECLQLLFAADRAHHLESEIIPMLKEGHFVVCDRYIFSTLAYGTLNIEDENWLKQINERFILPDLTILMKVSPNTCIERIDKNRFSFEVFEKRKELEEVWKNYKKLGKEFSGVYKVSGEGSIDEVRDRVWGKVSEELLD